MAERHALLQDGDDGPVLRRGVVEIIRRDATGSPEHVLGHDRRIAGDVFGEVPRDQAAAIIQDGDVLRWAADQQIADIGQAGEKMRKRQAGENHRPAAHHQQHIGPGGTATLLLGLRLARRRHAVRDAAFWNGVGFGGLFSHPLF